MMPMGSRSFLWIQKKIEFAFVLIPQFIDGKIVKM